MDRRCPRNTVAKSWLHSKPLNERNRRFGLSSFFIKKIMLRTACKAGQFCGLMIFTEALRCCQESKEVLTTHEHRNSRGKDPGFPSSHEADTRLLFSVHWTFGYGR